MFEILCISSYFITKKNLTGLLIKSMFYVNLTDIKVLIIKVKVKENIYFYLLT